MYVCKMNVLEGESDLELISFQFFILHFGFHPIDSFSSKSHKISFTYIVQYVLNTYTAHIWRCSVKNWNWYNYDNNTPLNLTFLWIWGCNIWIFWCCKWYFKGNIYDTWNCGITFILCSYSCLMMMVIYQQCLKGLSRFPRLRKYVSWTSYRKITPFNILKINNVKKCKPAAPCDCLLFIIYWQLCTTAFFQMMKIDVLPKMKKKWKINEVLTYRNILLQYFL